LLPAFFRIGADNNSLLQFCSFSSLTLPRPSTMLLIFLRIGAHTLFLAWQRLAALAFTLVLATPRVMFAGDAPVTIEDLVAHHLDAIGTAQVRAAAQTRAVQGTAVYRILVGGSGSVEGKTGMVSEGRKLRFMTKFSRSDYRGEQFVFNDGRIEIAIANADQTRSAFAEFVRTQSAILREGIFGGVLSTGWALLDISERKPKLTYQGLKKIDGQNLYQVRYEPRKTSDLEIRLYFDPETFRHVRTVYTLSIGSNVGADITQSAKQRPERIRLEEKFSTFEELDGLRMPTHWNIQFTRETPTGSTTVTEWDLSENQITNNIGLDPKNFEVK
jgi:hypothetical protein